MASAPRCGKTDRSTTTCWCRSRRLIHRAHPGGHELATPTQCIWPTIPLDRGTSLPAGATKAVGWLPPTGSTPGYLETAAIPTPSRFHLVQRRRCRKRAKRRACMGPLLPIMSQMGGSLPAPGQALGRLSREVLTLHYRSTAGACGGRTLPGAVESSAAGRATAQRLDVPGHP